MSKLIQIRNVPDRVHRTLKARAALLGMSLQEYLLLEIKKVADRPSVEELRERLAARAPVKPKTRPTTVLRRERDRR